LPVTERPAVLPTAVLPTPAVFWPVAAPIATLYDPLLP
jgi:hypothetical protein